MKKLFHALLALTFLAGTVSCGNSASKGEVYPEKATGFIYVWLPNTVEQTEDNADWVSYLYMMPDKGIVLEMSDFRHEEDAVRCYVTVYNWKWNGSEFAMDNIAEAHFLSLYTDANGRMQQGTPEIRVYEKTPSPRFRFVYDGGEFMYRRTDGDTSNGTYYLLRKDDLGEELAGILEQPVYENLTSYLEQF